MAAQGWVADIAVLPNRLRRGRFGKPMLGACNCCSTFGIQPRLLQTFLLVGGEFLSARREVRQHQQCTANRQSLHDRDHRKPHSQNATELPTDIRSPVERSLGTAVPGITIGPGNTKSGLDVSFNQKCSTRAFKEMASLHL